MSREIKANPLGLHFLDLQTFPQVDLVAEFNDLERLDQLVIELAEAGVQTAHFADDRCRVRFVLPVQQTVVQHKFTERPGERRGGHRLRFGRPGRR